MGAIPLQGDFLHPFLALLADGQANYIPRLDPPPTSPSVAHPMRE
jgi:hypothetical protein